jgi:hypothetical protein
MRFDLELVPEDTKHTSATSMIMRAHQRNGDTLRELLATALDANLSIISVSQNKDTSAWRRGRDHHPHLRR